MSSKEFQSYLDLNKY